MKTPAATGGTLFTKEGRGNNQESEEETNLIKILLNGYKGKLGRAVIEAAAQKPEEFSIVAGVDIPDIKPALNLSFPVFDKLRDCEEEADLIVDCSHHSITQDLLEYAEAKKLPAVICTTGQTPEELEIIQSYAKKIPIFKSPNMSIGANLMANLAKRAAMLLKDDFDIEIIEKHHNQKIDAPSGTALMIAEDICSVFEAEKKPEYVYERQSEKCARQKKELGIHTIRGGTIVGEHEVIFAGPNEIITISHSAQSREMFACGALAAAKFLIGKPAALYDMKDLINQIIE